jgi:hypothetical protein
VKRALRSLLALALLGSAGALTVNASTPDGATPVIGGLGPSPAAYVVTPGQTLTVSGQNFSSSLKQDDCQVAGLPTVWFYPLDGSPRQGVQPSSNTDGSQCSNQLAVVKVPTALSGAAHVSIADPSGLESNNGPGGFIPIVTVQPTASVNPSAGQVGTTANVQGANLRPLSLSPGAALTLSVGGAAKGASWGATTITFSPGTSSGEVQASFPVSVDAGDPGNLSKQATVVVDAGNYSFLPPSLDAATLAHQVVGSRLNLTGRNLGPSGTVAFPGGARGQAVSWSAEEIGVTVPPGAQPGVIVANVAGFGNVNGPSIALDPTAGRLSPTSGSANQLVRVSGFNFGATSGQVTVGSAPEPVAGWADQAVSFAISPETDGGDVSLTRADGASVPLGTLAIIPRLDRLENNNVPAGSQVVVDGVSLGANQGTATVGASPAQALLWSRQSVLLQLPVDLRAGAYPVVVTSAAGASSNPVSLTIVPGPTPKPGAKPASTGIGGALAPNFDNNHDFVKPIKPPSPVYFNVSADPHKVKAGDTANVVVTLKLNDKPVKGAAVKLSMLFTPGNDYKFSPDSGVTDADGTFTATLQTSKNAGDSIIAATSGVFSDQDHVLGTGDAKAASPTLTNPAAQNGGFAPLLALGVAAVALVTVGFYLNIRSMAG